MTDIWVKRIGSHRGAPRVFLDGMQAARAGFAPGERFDVEVDGQRVIISRSQDGTRMVSRRVKGERELPVIDINSKELLAIFDGMEAVRVVVGRDRVYLLPLASEVKKVERLERLAMKMANDEPLKMGSLSHGGGILSHAIHQGLHDAGVKAELSLVNEIREDLIEQAIEHNPAWGGETSAVVMAMQEVVQDDWIMNNLPKLEVLEMGLPCSGASKAGSTKRGLEMMEQHPEVGHLVFSALVILNKTQPAVVLLENVIPYKDTASAQILRQQLRDMGYDCHEAVLEGKDFGCLENRVRWCLVAVTRGVQFDFERLAPAVRIVQRLGAVLDENIGPHDERWRSFQHLKDKRERDVAKGANFKMQTVSEDSTSVPTLRKGYHKGGSTDPLLQHPENPALLRLLTAAEHARVKGVPVQLIEGLSETTAHQLLGQGIVYEPFRAVGQRIGRLCCRCVSEPSGGPTRPMRTTVLRRATAKWRADKEWAMSTSNDPDVLPYDFDLLYDIKSRAALIDHLSGRQRLATSATDQQLVDLVRAHSIDLPEASEPVDMPPIARRASMSRNIDISELLQRLRTKGTILTAQDHLDAAELIEELQALRAELAAEVTTDPSVVPIHMAMAASLHPSTSGWYAALSDAQHCKALDDHTRGKLRDLHLALATSEGLQRAAARKDILGDVLSPLIEMLAHGEIKYGTPGTRDCDVTEHNQRLRAAGSALVALREQIEGFRQASTPQPAAEYHEDLGPVLWWRLPVEEPPHVGTPLGSEWPGDGHFSHFTLIPIPGEQHQDQNVERPRG